MNEEGLDIHVSTQDLPGPGESLEMEVEGFLINLDNIQPPAAGDDANLQPGDLVKYVPVDITAPSSVVQHAAAVYQRSKRTRVDRWTLCDRQGTRQVKRRRDAEPLTNVTCAQCRHRLVEEGLLTD